MYKKSWKKIVAVFIFCVALGGSIVFLALGGEKLAPYETVTVSLGEVVEEVASTGRVKPAETLELSFEVGGRITNVTKKVGERVVAGEVLMQIGNAGLYAEKAQADASVRSAQAILEQLLRGARPEELEIKHIAVENAVTALRDAEEHVRESIRDAYVKADDAVRNKTDVLYSNARTSDPVLTSVIIDNGFRSELSMRRMNVEEALVVWERIPEGELIERTGDIEKRIVLIGAYLDRIAFAINNEVSPNSAVSQGVIDGWRADIAGARANISSAVASVTTAKQSMSSAASGVRLAKSDLILTEAGSDSNKIDAQSADVDGAHAHERVLTAQIEKLTLRAPIGGVIAKQDIRVGETVAAYAPAVTLISDTRLEIETFVPEADIALVHVGLFANVTLDAYSESDIFSAKVAKIDPAETIIEGVATYKVTLVFTARDERVRSGMTANVTIESAKRKDVVAIPLRALNVRENGEEFVRIPEDGTLTEVMVKTGLRGSDGMVEILEGVSVGDAVVTFLKDESDTM